MSINYSLIFPAYNEAENIENAIRETAAVFDPIKGEYEIIVVDDGSTDATAEIVERMAQEFPAVRLLRHEGNCGKGTAVRTGVMNARGELLLFMDCDLATHPREAPAFIAQMEDYDMAIASRRVPGSSVAKPQPWLRSLSGRVINFSIRHFFKLPHHDTQCGFKMFKAETARTLFKDLGPSRWLFDVEVLLRARSAGCRVKEMPVVWTNGPATRVRFFHVLPDLWHLWRLKKRLG